jgi:hypothetical protein
MVDQGVATPEETMNCPNRSEDPTDPKEKKEPSKWLRCSTTTTPTCP